MTKGARNANILFFVQGEENKAKVGKQNDR